MRWKAQRPRPPPPACPPSTLRSPPTTRPPGRHRNAIAGRTRRRQGRPCGRNKSANGAGSKTYIWLAGGPTSCVHQKASGCGGWWVTGGCSPCSAAAARCPPHPLCLPCLQPTRTFILQRSTGSATFLPLSPGTSCESWCQRQRHVSSCPSRTCTHVGAARGGGKCMRGCRVRRCLAQQPQGRVPPQHSAAQSTQVGAAAGCELDSADRPSRHAAPSPPALLQCRSCRETATPSAM